MALYLTGKIDLRTGREEIDAKRISTTFEEIRGRSKMVCFGEPKNFGMMGSDSVSFTKSKSAKNQCMAVRVTSSFG